MLSGKKVIGIVPNAPLFRQTESRYEDYYLFCDTYCTRIMESGMIPVGVLPVGGSIRTEVLDLCDAILIQGGKSVYAYHVDAVDHAVKTGKKVLGICLGCQALQCYFSVLEEAKKRNWQGTPGDLYKELGEKKNTFLVPVKGHRPRNMLPRPEAEVEAIKHRVTLTPGSLAARVFGTTELMGASIHVYCIGKAAPGLVVSGRADDGVVETVEAGEKILGTQFHPDVDDKLKQVFDWLKA